MQKIEVSKSFKAPIELVWQVWEDPELVRRWWGPKNFTSPFANIDLRVGGKSIVSMQAPKELGGQIYFSLWQYTKIEYLKTIEFIREEIILERVIGKFMVELMICILSYLKRKET